MEKKGIGVEVKVGIFVLVGLIILGYMTLRVNKYKFEAKEGYDLMATFDSASGLVKGSPVEIAGIEVGRVSDIELKGDRAQVALNIQKGVPIYTDSKAVIQSKGVLGDKYISIIPGTPSEPPLRNGGVIAQSQAALGFDDLLAKAEPALDNISDVTKSLSDVLGTKEGKNNLKETFYNIRKTTEDVRSMTLWLSEGEGTLGKLIRDDALYNDMRKTTADLKDTVAQIHEGKGSLGKFVKDDQFYDETKKTMDSLQRVAVKLDTGQGTLGKLINDDSLYKEAKETVTNLKQTSQKINEGQGSLGKLVNDESLYKEAKQTLRSVNRATEGLSEQVPISILGTIIGTVIK
jgi:phospholipid/cholesterol/gamma-HCH transport system substrate-binding protein